MITAERTYDTGLIKYVIFSIWDEVAPSGVTQSEFDPDMDNSTWLEIWDNVTFLGVYKIHHYQGDSVMAHANVLPEHRRQHTSKITKAVADWMKENLDSDYKDMVVVIPEDRPNVLKYAYDIGFKDHSRVLSIPLEELYKYEG